MGKLKLEIVLYNIQKKFTANIIYEGFEGLNTIKRHKLVYSSLDSYIKSGELHAISLKTYANKDEID